MKKRVVAGLAAAAMVVVGCSNKWDPADEDYINASPSKWVQASDGVKDFTKLETVTRDRANGLLRLQVNIRNKRQSEQHILFRFVWLDEKGFEIPTVQDAWTLKILGAGETGQIVGIAPSPLAASAIIKLKETVRDK